MTTLKSTLSLTLTRQELGATFECRVESEALESTVRNSVKIDLQGKWQEKKKKNQLLFKMVVFLLFTHTFPVAHKMSKYVSIIDEINLKSNRFIYELMVSIMDVDKSQNKLILVHFVSFFALLFLRVLFFIVRPRKIEVSSNFDQHTIQGSQVILLCKVSTNE